MAALACASAQQTIPPPPRPPDSEPSLEATLTFIRTKLSEEGKIAYSVTVTDTAQQGTEWANQFEVDLSNPAIDAPSCRISFHWRAKVNGSLADDKDYTLDLREVKTIVVLPQAENQRQVDARNGHPGYQSRIARPLFALVAKRPGQVENVFLFTEPEMAHRVAKEMVHAIELCGPGGAAPF